MPAKFARINRLIALMIALAVIITVSIARVDQTLARPLPTPIPTEPPSPPRLEPEPSPVPTDEIIATIDSPAPAILILAAIVTIVCTLGDCSDPNSYCGAAASVGGPTGGGEATLSGGGHCSKQTSQQGYMEAQIGEGGAFGTAASGTFGCNWCIDSASDPVHFQASSGICYYGYARADFAGGTPPADSYTNLYGYCP